MELFEAASAPALETPVLSGVAKGSGLHRPSESSDTETEEFFETEEFVDDTVDLDRKDKSKADDSSDTDDSSEADNSLEADNSSDADDSSDNNRKPAPAAVDRPIVIVIDDSDEEEDKKLPAFESSKIHPTWQRSGTPKSCLKQRGAARSKCKYNVMFKPVRTHVTPQSAKRLAKDQDLDDLKEKLDNVTTLNIRGVFANFGIAIPAKRAKTKDALVAFALGKADENTDLIPLFMALLEKQEWSRSQKN